MYPFSFFSFKAICLGLLFFISSKSLHSQSPSVSNPWVEYLNECSNWLNKNHQHFIDLNQNLNSCIKDRPSNDSIYLVKRYSISYPMWQYLKEDNIMDPKIDLENYYKRAISLADSIPLSHKQAIMDRVNKSHTLMVKYFDLCKQIENKTQRSDYLSKIEAKEIYAWLDSYSLACFDFSALQYILYQEIEDTYRPKATPLTINDMQLLVSSSSQLIFSLRRNDKEMAAKNVESISLLLTHFEPQEELSPSLRNRPRLENKVFDSFIARANEILSLGNDFLASKTDYLRTKPYLDEYGSAYYYGNEIIQKFSNKKNGLVKLYNEFTSASKISVLTKCAEPNWFPVIKVDSEKPLEKLNVDSLINVFQQKIIEEKSLTVAPSLDGFANNNLVFLLDVSASMNRPEKLPLLKEALKYFLNLTRKEDQISIVTYSGVSKVVLQPTSAIEKEKILKAIDDINFSGKTDASRGLQLAYKLVNDHLIENGNNRIILASDGEFELEKQILKLVRDQADEGIRLSAFCFGKFVTEDINKFMKKITQEGGGNYAHIIEGDGAFEALMKEAKAIRNDE
jgi:Mg-chelatase subunit ChlD